MNYNIIYFILLLIIISIFILYYNMNIYKITIEDFKNFNQDQE